jgi:hypothetical protein
MIIKRSLIRIALRLECVDVFIFQRSASDVRHWGLITMFPFSDRRRCTAMTSRYSISEYFARPSALLVMSFTGFNRSFDNVHWHGWGVNTRHGDRSWLLLDFIVSNRRVMWVKKPGRAITRFKGGEGRWTSEWWSRFTHRFWWHKSVLCFGWRDWWLSHLVYRVKPI